MFALHLLKAKSIAMLIEATAGHEDVTHFQYFLLIQDHKFYLQKILKQKAYGRKHTKGSNANVNYGLTLCHFVPTVL